MFLDFIYLLIVLSFALVVALNNKAILFNKSYSYFWSKINNSCT